MAGIGILQLTADGEPQCSNSDYRMSGTESVTGGVSDKMCDNESQNKVEPVVVSVSPQGKGVGVFGLEGSPRIGSQKNEGPLKDPKVNGLLHISVYYYLTIIT